jgi:hypothetical protein
VVAGAPQLEETPWRRRGQPPVAARAPLASPGEGKREILPSWNSWTGHACQLGGPTIPSVRMATARAGRRDAVQGERGKCEKEEGRETPTCGSHTSAREEKKESTGGLGCEV